MAFFVLRPHTYLRAIWRRGNMVIEIISRGFERNLTSWFAISKNVCAWGGETDAGGRQWGGGRLDALGKVARSGFMEHALMPICFCVAARSWAHSCLMSGWQRGRAPCTAALLFSARWILPPQPLWLLSAVSMRAELSGARLIEYRRDSYLLLF